MGAFGRGGLRALGWGESVAEGGAEATLDGDVTAGVRLAHHHRALTWSRPPVLVMRALTFGPPVFETPIARIEPDADVLFGLLLYVSAADPRGVSRDELSRIIWPSATTEQGRHSLRQALYRLRQLGVPIHLRAGQVSIEENDTEIDLRELLHGPIDRSDLVRIGTQSFLPGYSPQLGRAYLEWVDELRDRAASVRRRALAAAIVDARAQARFGDIPELARALLALDPLNETATLSLAEALVMDGSKVDALMLLDRYESEVGEISEALRIPVRTLRRRVSEGMDEALMPLRFEVPFVGRVREFGELRDAWSSTRRNVGQCAVVTGEAGIGKTRTSTELLRLAVLDGGLVVTYACGAGDTVAPLSSLLGLTGMLLNQPGALGCGQEHLNYLRRLLHPDPQQPLSSGMTADLAYAQLVYSLSELVAAITEEAPLVIFIDDAHRLHQTSWRIFTDVTNRLPERSLLLLLAARQLPEFYPTLGITSSDGRVRHVRLPSMGYADAELFLERWSERNRVPFAPDEVARFTAAAAGNPFYLGELAAHRGRGGADDAPPATIRGLIELQFAALREHAQRVLLVVSLLQTHATLERVTRVLELTPMEFLSALEELEQAGLIGSRLRHLYLRHDVVGDVTQRLASQSVLLYLQTACAIACESEHDDPDALTIAASLWRATGDVSREARVCQRLGDSLLARFLPSEAAAAFSRSIDAGGTTLQAAAAHLGLRRALVAACDWPRLAELPRPAEMLHLPRSDRAEADLVDLECAFWSSGAFPDRNELGTFMNDTTLPQVLRSRATQLALVVWDNSEGEWSLPLTDDAAEVLVGQFASQGSYIPQLIWLTRRGDRSSVRELANLVLAGTAQSPEARLMPLRMAAHALIRVGQPEDARPLLELALTDADRLGLGTHLAVASAILARISAHLNDWSRAESNLSLLGPATDEPPADMTSRFRFFAQCTRAAVVRDRYSIGALTSALNRVLPLEEAADPDSYVIARFHLASARSEAPSATMAEWAAGRGRHVLGRGSFDFTAASICRGLRLLMGRDRSRAYLDEYIAGCRPETTPMAADLVSLALD